MDISANHSCFFFSFVILVHSHEEVYISTSTILIIHVRNIYPQLLYHTFSVHNFLLYVRYSLIAPCAEKPWRQKRPLPTSYWNALCGLSESLQDVVGNLKSRLDFLQELCWHDQYPQSITQNMCITSQTICYGKPKVFVGSWFKPLFILK